MIPKIIHYCWFGKNPKPDIVKTCINSWHKYCPDWEIIEWNESNVDISSHPYMKEAYESKKWAFVSDVVRLSVVLRLGGVYLDTDVELVDSLDKIIGYQSFFVFETERNIATGLGFGAEKGHPCIQKLLGYYDEKNFIQKGKMDLTPCPAGNTEVISEYCRAFRRNGKTQILNEAEVVILSFKDYSSFAIHHATASWVEGPKNKKRPYRDTRVKRILRNSQIFAFLEKYFSKKIVKIYTLLVYDFLELGVVYYIKRMIFKKKK